MCEWEVVHGEYGGCACEWEGVHVCVEGVHAWVWRVCMASEEDVHV